MLRLLTIFLAQTDFKLSSKKELNGEYDFLKEKFSLFKNIFKYFIRKCQASQHKRAFQAKMNVRRHHRSNIQIQQEART